MEECLHFPLSLKLIHVVIYHSWFHQRVDQVIRTQQLNSIPYGWMTCHLLTSNSTRIMSIETLQEGHMYNTHTHTLVYRMDDRPSIDDA